MQQVDEGQDVEVLSSTSSSLEKEENRILLCNLFDERIIFQLLKSDRKIRSEEDYSDFLIETRGDEILEYLERKVDHFDKSTIKNYLKIEIVNRSLDNDSICVESVNILFNDQVELDESDTILQQALRIIKKNGIETLHTRDFAEFRESSLKFMLNYELNRLLKDHPIYVEKQLNSSPSITEMLALNIETNRNGYIDLYIECLNTIIEFKHIHMGYVSFSKDGFIGIEDETLSERIGFQRRESKSPLDQLLQLVDRASLSDILKKWSVARLASVYKNQKLPFPTEFVRGYNPQTYYFEPVSMIFQEAREQILNYEIENNPNPKRLLIINIGKRLFYQFVTEDQDWKDFKEI